MSLLLSPNFMCGIFAYVGPRNNAAKIVLDGLRLLEYRGYDSWGIAAKIENALRSSEPKDLRRKLKLENSKILLEKHVGKIGNAKLNSQFSTFKSRVAIGHTRWATHGGVTVKNAHPHLDCTKTIAVLHNGIIEKFEEIKKELIKKGHKFISETDTEVASHLIEDNLKTHNFLDSTRLAFNQFKGMNALVILNANSNKIVAVKNGSPLVVGIGRNEMFIASDAAGIAKHTKQVIFLEDNQMVEIGKTLSLYSLPSGKAIKYKTATLEWDFEEADRGKYKHFLMKEIAEQPTVVENIATTRDSEVKSFSEVIRAATGTFFLGCGTASYAALAGTYLFSRIAKHHVNFSIGSEFKYLEDYLTPKSLVVAISQSGETIDVIEPINHAKARGAQIGAIVNVIGSTLYRTADHKILLGAGPEIAVVGTKSFIAMFSLLLLIAFALTGNLSHGKKILLKAAKNTKTILKDSYLTKIRRVAKQLARAKHIYVLGRGLSYATALEATLKIKETSCIHAEGFAGGELKHGVMALIEKGTPVIVFAPNDETHDEIISNAQEVKARGAFVIGIGPRNNDIFDKFLPTEDLGDATLISQITISQLLAYFLALEVGIKDPDKPRNLAKSVTVK